MHSRVGLDSAEDLEAVHLRHHQIEQHQIEIVDLQEAERLPPALGGGDPVPVPGQAARQQGAVGLHVVDHQDVAGFDFAALRLADRTDAFDQASEHGGRFSRAARGRRLVRRRGAGLVPGKVDDGIDLGQQLVGLIEQVLEAGGSRRQGAHAEAGGQWDRCEALRRDAAAQPQRERETSLYVRFGQQHAELLASVAADQLAVVPRGDQLLGQPADHLVAGRMAVFIVDALEVVDIHHHAAQLAAIAYGRFELQLGLLHEGAPVDGARQRVAGRHDLELVISQPGLVA